MNKTRRDAIKKLITRTERIKTTIDRILLQEEKYYKNCPYEIKFSPIGERSAYVIVELENASERVQECRVSLEGILE